MLFAFWRHQVRLGLIIQEYTLLGLTGKLLSLSELPYDIALYVTIYNHMILLTITRTKTSSSRVRYHMSSKDLLRVDKEEDLGVHVCANFKWDAHTHTHNH